MKNDGLEKYLNLVISNKTTQAMRLLKRMSKPTIKNKSHISFMGWTFNVSTTVYYNANSIDIKLGFEYLLSRGVPFDIYTRVLFYRSVYHILVETQDNAIAVDEETFIDNTLEPEIIELLRFCYWVNICKENLGGSFETKFNEAKNSLRIDANSRKKLENDILKFTEVAQDGKIPFEVRANIANRFFNNLASFVHNISSYLPEFMLAAIVHEQGFDVKFNKTMKSKTCDLIFSSYQTEIKTKLDKSEYNKIEQNLYQELLGTLKREKIVDAINDALNKKAEIVFLFLTLTSLGIGFGKFTFKKNNKFQIDNALRISISLAKENREKKHIKTLPAVVFTTLISAVDKKYKIFSFTLPYSVKKINSKVVADPNKLLIDAKEIDGFLSK